MRARTRRSRREIRSRDGWPPLRSSSPRRGCDRRANSFRATAPDRSASLDRHKGRAALRDPDRRRQVEEWMRTLAEKYPEFKIEVGLRDYYLAEATRLRGEFDKAADLTEKLALGRNIETFLDRAAEYDRRISER